MQEIGTAYVFITSAETAQDKAPALRAYQKANLEINKLLNRPENEASYRKTISEVSKVSLEVANSSRIPVFSETNLTISQLAYLPSRLKKVGFFKGRFELGPVIFR